MSIYKKLIFTVKRIVLSFLLMAVLGLMDNKAQLPEHFVQFQVVKNLNPINMAFAPDGRLFLLHKDGRIQIVENDVIQDTPFLEIEVDDLNERGLLGIAFHPEFEANNFFYLYYTVKGEKHNRVSRFEAGEHKAIPGSETIIADLDPLPGSIHNGGELKFGPEDKLYVATGDAYDAEKAQSLESVLGKILRFNDDGSIPEDNPFYNDTEGLNRAIWAIGLRNPFSFDIDPISGKLFANDVGEGRYEEINHIKKGANFGWPSIEGPRYDQPMPSNYEEPFYAYDHDTGCAVVGAAFHNPEKQSFPLRYQGKYFFADYCGGYIKVLDPVSGEILETFASGINRAVSISFDPNGNMYYLERAGKGGGSVDDNTRSLDGVLWKVMYNEEGNPVVSKQPESKLVSVGDKVVFSVNAMGLEPLSYQWQRNGEDLNGATESSLTIESASLADSGSVYQCWITNTKGNISSNEAILKVTTDTRPQPTIIAPENELQYSGGDRIFYSGEAFDEEDDGIPSSSFSWWIDFHHDDHTHPAMPLTLGKTGYFNVPKIGETDANVWYRIYLNVKDSVGLSKTVYTEIFPHKTQITLNTQPPELELILDGQKVNTPFTFTGVAGTTRKIEAIESQLKDDKILLFNQWSEQFNDAILLLDIPFSDSTLTANFTNAPFGDRGLIGSYYNSDKEFGGSPVLTRLDPGIDFFWGEASPDEDKIQNDNFSVRWVGGLIPQYSEKYNFYVNADDGIRLWVDGKKILDIWNEQDKAYEWISGAHLVRGQMVSLKLEYFESNGDATAQLNWSSPHTSKEIIPLSQLRPYMVAKISKEFAKDLTFKVYPNPTSKVINVSINKNKEETVRLILIDNIGRILKKKSFNLFTGKNNIEISLAGMQKGLYKIIVIKNNQVTSQSFIRL